MEKCNLSIRICGLKGAIYLWTIATIFLIFGATHLIYGIVNAQLQGYCQLILASWTVLSIIFPFKFILIASLIIQVIVSILVGGIALYYSVYKVVATLAKQRHSDSLVEDVIVAIVYMNVFVLSIFACVVYSKSLGHSKIEKERTSYQEQSGSTRSETV